MAPRVRSYGLSIYGAAGVRYRALCYTCSEAAVNRCSACSLPDFLFRRDSFESDTHTHVLLSDPIVAAVLLCAIILLPCPPPTKEH